jgi:hypothetical protein
MTYGIVAERPSFKVVSNNLNAHGSQATPEMPDLSGHKLAKLCPLRPPAWLTLAVSPRPPGSLLSPRSKAIAGRAL